MLTTIFWNSTPQARSLSCLSASECLVVQNIDSARQDVVREVRRSHRGFDLKLSLQIDSFLPWFNRVETKRQSKRFLKAREIVLFAHHSIHIRWLVKSATNWRRPVNIASIRQTWEWTSCKKTTTIHPTTNTLMCAAPRVAGRKNTCHRAARQTFARFRAAVKLAPGSVIRFQDLTINSIEACPNAD